MTYETISIEQRGAVDWLTLNRPEALNSINNQMVADLSDYFGRLFHAPNTRIVVMRGAGRAYCAGLDIKSQGSEPAPFAAVSAFRAGWPMFM